MSAPEIDNRTPFVVEPYVLLEKHGEVLVTLVKATYEEARGALVVADLPRRRPLRFIDEPWGDPASTPPKYPADACGHKPGTDVVIVAKGYAPDGKPVATFEVAANVGPLQKTLRVFGLRVWLEGGSGLSTPRPTAEEEIRYDHAWGGLDDTDPARPVEEPRNPVGRGIARDRSRLTHQLAPSIEDPRHPLTSAQGGEPAGFGSIGPHWMPRRRHQGTYDAAWQRDQCPLLPLDRDDRANLCASPGLSSMAPLTGGEEVALMNLVAGGGLLSFSLPRVRPRLSHARSRREPATYTPHLDTVIVDTLEVGAESRATVELVWRTVTPVPRRMSDLTVTVEADGA